MFLRTFSISEKVVQTVSLKLQNSPAFMADRRGKHTSRPARISDEVKECINDHISSFPLVESHYTRERTKKKYLDSDLNISKMYRLYKEWVTEKVVCEDAKNATFRQYNDIFNNHSNISFFKPKSDLCDQCEKYKLSKTEEKVAQQTNYDQHLINKNIVRTIKNEDKERGLLDPKLCVACFDLQKVLTALQGESSSFYYKRKFATYNLTVYDIGKKLGYCFIWNESEAKRGANEIATCLLKFMTLLKHKYDTTEFIFIPTIAVGKIEIDSFLVCGSMLHSL